MDKLQSIINSVSKEEIAVYKAKKGTPSHEERIQMIMAYMSMDLASRGTPLHSPLFHQYIMEYSLLERAEAIGRFNREE